MCGGLYFRLFPFGFMWIVSRKDYREGGAFVDSAFDLYASAVQFNELFCQSQTYSVAATLTPAPFCAEIRFEYSLSHFFYYAYTCVGDAYDSIVANASY